jgi:glyoxylase-like metal-dependent hydrolase (beta-lactamase superfamily II)
MSVAAPRPSATKPPRPVLSGIWAFAPNRDALGGTAYLLQAADGNLLIDCPPWDDTTRQFLSARGGVRWLVLTHRGAIAHVAELHNTYDCDILIQEQEAYLLPGLPVTPFQQEHEISPTAQVIWTPGHSPGSACVYTPMHSGVLFSGRHLLPDRQGNPVPLRLSKTFHWPRQLRSVEKLRDRFSPDTLQHLCPGANLGFLRGQPTVAPAYEKLVALDLAALRTQPPGL